MPDGRVDEGFQVALTSPEGGEIYYSIERYVIHARFWGRCQSACAVLYTGPITIDSTTVVTARVRNLSHTSVTGANNPPLSSKWSGVATARFAVDRAPQPGDLVVTEIQYRPASPTPAELSVDAGLSRNDFEFIEILNVSEDPLDLNGTRFVDGIEFAFAGSTLEILDAGARVVLVRDQSAFDLRYGPSGRVAGEYDGGLSDSGEVLKLVDEADVVLLEFEFKDGWVPVTDGVGFSLVLVDETTPAANLGNKTSWRQSGVFHGSAGLADPEPPVLPGVVINEALTNSEDPVVDVVELLNLSADSADISGWFLSDDRDELFKFRFPEGTTIDSGGFLIVDETVFRPTPDTGFSLSSFGESVHLLSADLSGTPTGYLHEFSFGAAETGVPFGRVVNSEGEEHFVAQTATTFGEQNAGPLVGPVVVNEIMYHPEAGEVPETVLPEFIELFNLTDQEILLQDALTPANVWTIDGGVEFSVPPATTIAANGFLLVVDFDPADAVLLAAFRDRHEVPAGVPVEGPFEGRLSNGGDSVRLFKPGAPVDDGSAVPPVVPEILVDRIDYSENAPWPVGASGTGFSIQRVASGDYGNEPLNWAADAPTPGRRNAGSLLVIESAVYDSGTMSIRFHAEAGKSYSVLSGASLLDGDWVKLMDVNAPAESGTVQVDDTEAGTDDVRFYRVVTPAVP